jgi:hypothetical protein
MAAAAQPKLEAPIADPSVDQWLRVEPLPCPLTIEISVPALPSPISFILSADASSPPAGPSGKTFPAPERRIDRLERI